MIKAIPDIRCQIASLINEMDGNLTFGGNLAFYCHWCQKNGIPLLPRDSSPMDFNF